MATTKTRKSVPLDQEDERRLALVSTDETLCALAARHVHARPNAALTEATIMHALVVMGLDALEREADEERYAQLAASQDDEDREFHAAMRLRRRGE